MSRTADNSRLGIAYVSSSKAKDMESSDQVRTSEPQGERLSYSLHEAAELLGVDYFSVYRLVKRKKLRASRALRGKLLIPRTDLLRLLNTE